MLDGTQVPVKEDVMNCLKCGADIGNNIGLCQACSTSREGDHKLWQSRTALPSAASSGSAFSSIAAKWFFRGLLTAIVTAGSIAVWTTGHQYFSSNHSGSLLPVNLTLPSVAVWQSMKRTEQSAAGQGGGESQKQPAKKQGGPFISLPSPKLPAGF